MCQRWIGVGVGTNVGVGSRWSRRVVGMAAGVAVEYSDSLVIEVVAVTAGGSYVFCGATTRCQHDGKKRCT